MAEKYCNDHGVNILITHLFMAQKGEALPEEPEDEKPILHVGGAQVVYADNVPAQIQYTAIGHLHRMHKVGNATNPVYYSGSPVSYSFAEANQDKYVLVVDVVPGGEASVSPVQLAGGKRLLRKRADGMDEALHWLSENKDALVELTLVTDTFITANERKQLNAIHSGLVSIIPEVKMMRGEAEGARQKINLNRSMEELFADYFKHEHGQEPNEEIMDLFKEVLGG
jgi:exonuclease SbcD